MYSIYQILIKRIANMEENIQTTSTMEHTETPAATGVSPAASSDTAITKIPFYKQKNVLVAFVIIILGSLGAGGYYFYKTRIQGQGPVAVVNGYPITRKDYNDSITLLTKNAGQQGANVNDPTVQATIKQQVLDGLINNALLIGGAKEAGITADKTKVDSEYQAIATQLGGEEQLKTQMQNIGLTPEKLRSNISDRIIVDAFLEANTEIKAATATPSEVSAFYASLKTQSTSTPPLSELQAEIKQQIVNQKQQTIVNDFIKSLKDKAKITINI